MIDFEKTTCQTKTTALRFGIIDDLQQPTAYLTFVDEKKWTAVVENSQTKEVTFTAIDNCIEIRRPNGDWEKSCDGMLKYERDIVFVELKNKAAHWITEGIEQLRTTVEYYFQQYNLKDFRKKRAFLANAKKPRFQSAQKERMQRFRDQTGVRLIIHNVIKLD